VAARFFLTTVLILPFAIREYKARRPAAQLSGSRRNIIYMCIAFCAGVILQQVGVGQTSVTNAGFLTGLYVIFVTVICAVFYKQNLPGWIYAAAALSVGGIWCLAGGRLDGLSAGDALVFACAIGFGAQVALVGKVTETVRSPLVLCLIQYSAVTVAALIPALLFEAPTLDALRGAAMPILYAGILSGGIGYTLQVVAQQYTPASDSAIIMSGESLFAALFGAMLLGERLLPLQYAGCALIALAIIMTELIPLLRKKKPVPA
jgi:drug/metabolite transporter (DMT)-like permease